MIFEYKSPNIGTKRIETYNDLKSALAWLGVGASSATYAGYVNDDGTAGSLPAGWSSTKTGTGAYTVTHNLGSTNYIVVATSAGGAFGVCSIYALNADDFDLSIVRLAASAQDTDFTFILLPTH